MKNLTCSFFGHRKIDITQELKEDLKKVLEDLIINKQVDTFLFGSRSNFDYLCHQITTELKQKHPQIKRISYTCPSESCILESERKKWEEIYSHFEKREVHLLGFEKEFEHKTKYTSGKATYVERNQAMINDSNICVFYYDKNYQPAPRKKSKNSINFYQPKSGTALAFNYAKQKKKTIINLFKS